MVELLDVIGQMPAQLFIERAPLSLTLQRLLTRIVGEHPLTIGDIFDTVGADRYPRLRGVGRIRQVEMWEALPGFLCQLGTDLQALGATMTPQEPFLPVYPDPHVSEALCQP